MRLYPLRGRWSVFPAAICLLRLDMSIVRKARRSIQVRFTSAVRILILQLTPMATETQLTTGEATVVRSRLIPSVASITLTKSSAN